MALIIERSFGRLGNGCDYGLLVVSVETLLKLKV